MIQFLFVFNDWGLLILRLVLGLVLVLEGFPKLRDLRGTAKNFEGSGMGFKPGMLFAVIAGVVECVGGLLLIFGFLTQIAAALVAIQFLVLVVVFGLIRREGFKEWRLDFLLAAMAFLLITSGGGVYSLDETLGLILY